MQWPYSTPNSLQALGASAHLQRRGEGAVPTMFGVVPKEDPAGSSSHNEVPGPDGDVDSRKGPKPSLAER